MMGVKVVEGVIGMEVDVVVAVAAAVVVEKVVAVEVAEEVVEEFVLNCMHLLLCYMHQLTIKYIKYKNIK